LCAGKRILYRFSYSRKAGIQVYFIVLDSPSNKIQSEDHSIAKDIMVTISPFPGIRYNLEQIDNLSTVISPPYDKVSKTERKLLWECSDFNVIRLILPPPSENETDVATQSTENESGEWYAQSMNYLQQWKNTGILRQDPNCLYLYQQRFPFEGRMYTRKGFFGALLLDEHEGAFAHEHTFEGPKADRLRLTRATKMNLSPIFLLGDGDLNTWEQLFDFGDTQLARFHDTEKQEHILIAVTDKDKIREITQFFTHRKLVIADGHHRYETALNYRREMMEQSGKNPAEEAWGWVLAYMTPVESPDLLVLPTHRVIETMPDRWFEQLRKEASSFCDIIPMNQPDSIAIHRTIAQSNNQNAIAVVSAKESALYTLKTGITAPALADIPQPIRDLNVSILHRFILSSCLGMSAEESANKIRYVREANEAIAMVREGHFQAAFILGKISPQTVFEVSLSGVRMPQKSTDFYPKIPTGLVLRSLAENGTK